MYSYVYGFTMIFVVEKVCVLYSVQAELKKHTSTEHGLYFRQTVFFVKYELRLKKQLSIKHD